MMLFAHCHLCNINFANPQRNENGEYICRQCGQGFVELIDNPRDNGQPQQQADIFMNFVQRVLQALPPDAIQQMQGDQNVPTDEAAIESLPKTRITEQNVDDFASHNCAVCLEDLQVGAIAISLPCDHHYHQNCLLPWIAEHNTCPVCRHELPAREMDPNQQQRDVALRAQQMIQNRLQRPGGPMRVINIQTGDGQMRRIRLVRNARNQNIMMTDQFGNRYQRDGNGNLVMVAGPRRQQRQRITGYATCWIFPSYQ